MISTSKLAPYAHYILADAVIPELPGYYRGKERENYDLRDGARILIANVLVSKRLAMMPVEIVVRDYLAGTTSTSILQMYKKGARAMYGHRFEDGLRDNQKLPHTIITPTTKAAQGAHDAPLSADEIITRKLLTEQQWREVSDKALALFAFGREMAARQGLMLVDTKYEFGFDAKGAIVLADEVHTPDSSRYWLAATYPARFAAGAPPDTLDK